MGWRRTEIYLSDECELVDLMQGQFKALEELARVSMDEDLKRQPMSEDAADAVLTYADELKEAREEVRRMDNERDEALEAALGLPEMTLAGIRMGTVEVESADIELSKNGGESGE